MKILFLTPAFYPDIGGVEKHVLEISKIIAAKGHDVLIITEDKLGRKDNKNSIYQSSGKSDNEAKRSKYPVKSIYSKINLKNNLRLFSFRFGENNFFKKFRIWFSLWRIRKIIKEQDVVWCHDVFIWYLPFRFIFPKKKVFTTFHGFETVFPPKLKAVILRKLSEILSKGNICVGDFIKKWYGTKPDFVTYGGVDVNKNSKLKVKNLKNKILKIIFIGRLEPDTGIKIYLKVLDNLKKRKVKFKFAALGDGSLRQQLEKYGKVYGLVKNIFPVLERSDLVFASSYLSIQEALSCGKEVIAVYDNPLKYDYLKLAPFSGFILIEKDPLKITDFIENGINRSGFKNKISESKTWPEKQTWEEVAEIYLALLAKK